MRIHRITGDGNCLFHSCGYVLSTCQCRIRKEVSQVISQYSETVINGQTVAEWVKFNGYCSISDYARKVSQNGFWGDGLCLAIIALIYARAIRIYERTSGGFKLMTEYFPELENPIKLLFGHEHYDVLIDDDQILFS